jgi:MFS transporter, ACS family, hexuronate transporter
MFMIKVHGLPFTAVGMAMTGFGIGAFLGTFVLGVVSDRIGRRKANIITLLLGGILGVIFASLSPGTPLAVLFGTILLYSFAVSGAAGASWTLITESAGFQFAATAIGIVTGIGELLGGGIFPAIGGGIADRLGIAATLYLTGFILIAAGLLSFFLRETLTRNKDALS